MKQIEDTISTLVQNHFPQFYNEDGESFVEFVKEYYRWMESSNNSIFYSRNLLEFRDIDTTIDDFLVHFKNKYLAEAPVFYDKTRSNVKHALDFYRSKGTERGTKLLFREVWGLSDVDIYFPGKDVIKASDGEWYVPVYLEVSLSDKTKDFVGKQITGSASSATAFVEEVGRKSVKGKHFDVLMLTNRQGNFILDDIITVDGNLSECPVVIGSLTNVQIENSGRNFAVGDVVDIISVRLGKQGKARIDSIVDSTGKVTFTLVNGGSGYRLTTVPVVAEKTLTTANRTSANAYITDFTIDEIIIQPLANVVFYSSNAFFSVGTLVTGSNSSADVATGRVLGKTQNQISGTGSATSSTNTVIGVGTSFNTQIANGDYIRFQSCTSIFQVSTTTNATHLTLTTTGPSLNSDPMYIANGNMLLIVTSGDFALADRIANTTALISTYTNRTATGILMGSNSGAIGLKSVSNVFSSNGHNFVYGQTSNVYANLVTVGTGSGANVSVGSLTDEETVFLNEDLILSNNSIANTILTGSVSSNATSPQVNGTSTTFTTDLYRGSYIKFSGNNSIFQVNSVTNNTVLILTANGPPTSTSTVLTGVASSNATSPQVNGTNTLFLSQLSAGDYIQFSGNGSNFQVNSVTNNTVLILTTNGPITTANTITVNPGSTTGITVKPGPYITLPLNALKFGFPKLQTANLSTIINLTLTRGSYDIGTIASLTGINPGSNYNINPFVQIRDVGISAFNRRDLHVETQNTTGEFIVGEEISQNFSRPSYTLSISGSNTAFTDLETVTQQINATSNNFGEVVSSNTSLAVLYTSGNFVNSALGANLTGTVTCNTSSSQVNGTATLFTSELSAGDYIKFSGNTLLFQVNNITSNTVLFLKTTGVTITGANNIAKASNVAVGLTGGKFFFVNAAVSNTVLSASRGTVLEVGNGYIDVKRKTFNQTFTGSVGITGSFSGATANVVSVTQIEDSQMMGNNAIITTSAGVVNGSIGSISVIDSGYAYEDGEDITITKEGSAFVATGYANLINQGVGEGYFKSTRGFLNSDKYIHDGSFYQAYSYQVRASVALGVYADTLKKLSHVAGTELFGNLIKTSNVDVQITSTGVEIDT